MVTWARLELATSNLKVLHSRPSELPGQIGAPKEAQTYHSSISLSSLAAMLNEHLVGGCDQINSFIKIRGVKLQQSSSYSRLLFFGLLHICGRSKRSISFFVLRKDRPFLRLF